MFIRPKYIAAVTHTFRVILRDEMLFFFCWGDTIGNVSIEYATILLKNHQFS